MKKYYVVLDTETAGKLETPLVYDLGYKIVDIKGNVYKSKSYVISDIFFEKNNDKLEVNNIMNSAYYKEKIPNYIKGIKKGEWEVNSFYNIRKELLNDIEKYNATVCAYNAGFDTNALNNTFKFLTNGKFKWFFKYSTPIFCIWHMACQTICTMKKYRTFCEKNGYISQKGNYQTSAEIVYRFIKNKTEFKENHTALEDVNIETEIMYECFKKHKKMDKSINKFCWRIPQKRKGR